MAATPSQWASLKKSSLFPCDHLIIAPLRLPAHNSFSSTPADPTSEPDHWFCFAETKSVSLFVISFNCLTDSSDSMKGRRGVTVACFFLFPRHKVLNFLLRSGPNPPSNTQPTPQPPLSLPRRPKIPSSRYVSTAVAILTPLA